ncbi:efflux RND transporter periplasmic adaptor subunit [Lichenicoccus roseus]|uniref:Efflux RND transporter periplasmic adaptor subunit n=1 Tax=Lichenicoccus roseus TaxID=2683649 RepID=A0A5R9J3N0_9PROT|nr:efflux RND transporter periplasmic adaptor subunit [Lichenicoccus roseus]TLU71107.1 efflux RND transporter periplasmic adaptor subunit [Lichenicoccus roseus]
MRRILRNACLLLASATTPLAAFAVGAVTKAEPAPSVLVTTIKPVSGTLPDRIEAYGMAVPANNATQTLSLLQEGRVRQILRAPGEAVQRGAPILEWEASALARQGWEQARTQLALALQERAHAALLLERHLGTRDQLDQATKALADAQASVDALRREGADRLIRTVTAPFDGTVVAVPVAAGDRVAAGATLATLARNDGIVVTVGVDPDRLADLHPGQAAIVQALRGGPARPASVLRVDAALNPRSRLVDVDLAATAGQVLPGSDMRAEITVGTLSGWLVPHAAVLEDGGGAYLFQADAGKAVLVKVAVLALDGDTDLVTGPIVASQPIVRTGASQLDNGDALHEATAP